MPINILFIIMSHKPELVSSSSNIYGNNQFYDKLENMMRKYYTEMKVDFKFIKCDPEMKEEYIVQGDTIFVRSVENRKDGILKKVKYGLIYGRNYDFIYKTNLCAVPNIELILEFCRDKINNKYLYAGPVFINTDTKLEFISGHGFLLNKNTVSLLLDNWDDSLNEHDDEFIALLLKKLNINCLNLPSFSIHSHNKNLIKNSKTLSDTWFHTIASNLVYFHVFKICIFKEILNPEIHLKIQEFICNTYITFNT